MKQRTVHRAWWILLFCVIFFFGAGIAMNCSTLAVATLRQALAFDPGAASVFFTIRTLTIAGAVPFITRWYFRVPVRVALVCHMLLLSGSFALLSCVSSIWQLYLLGIMNGLGYSFVGFAIPVILNYWFQKHTSLVLGIAMSASGIAGIIFNPVLSRLTSLLNWRLAILSIGLCGGMLMLFPALSAIIRRPADIGLEPYGAARPQAAARTESATVPSLPPASAFWLSTLILCFISAVYQFNIHLPLYVQSLGHPLSTAATVTSLAMAGNVLGKLIFGFSIDKLGFWRALALQMSLIALGLLLFLLSGSSGGLLYLAAFCYGGIFGVSVLSSTQLHLAVYGLERYKNYLGPSGCFANISGALIVSGIAFLYDAQGSFRLVLYLELGVYLLTLSAICLLSFICKKAGRKRAYTV